MERHAFRYFEPLEFSSGVVFSFIDARSLLVMIAGAGEFGSKVLELYMSKFYNSLGKPRAFETIQVSCVRSTDVSTPLLEIFTSFSSDDFAIYIQPSCGDGELICRHRFLSMVS
jgi:hypothetical protein